MPTDQKHSAPTAPQRVSDRIATWRECLDPAALDADGRPRVWLPRPVAEAEAAHVQAWRRANGRDDGRKLTGLALSGGGIRSATFGLGVLQTLVEAGILTRFDYLSTVSGGGYIGASLSFHARRRAGGCTPESFPYGVAAPAGPDGDSEKQRAALRHLRKHGRVLTPDRNMTLAAGAAAVIRSIFSNFVVWIPLLVVLMMAMRLQLGDMAGDPHTADLCRKPDLVGVLGWDTLVRSTYWQCWTSFTLALMVGGVLTIVAIAFAILYSLGTRLERQKRLRVSLFGGLTPIRRRNEVFSGRILIGVLGLAVVGSVPVADHLLAGWVAQLAPSAAAAGAISGLWSLLKGGPGGGAMPRAVMPIAAMLLLYGLLLSAYVLARVIGEPSLAWALWFAGLLAAGTILGWCANVNIVGLQRFYRDRLMEAFMPNLVPDPANGIPVPVTAAATDADRTYLKAEAGLPAAMPYHLINTNVVLLNSEIGARRERLGDSFCLTPHWCGGTATGWQPTRTVAEGNLSLATAMAVSGAAANPNTSVLSNPFVGILAALLNIRLGLWIANPNPFVLGRVKPPTHFHAMMYEIAKLFGRSYHERAGMIQLSDGGHFENLGIYELVRRRVATIVAVDATADPSNVYADLFRALRLIEEDFGVRPELDAAKLLGPLIVRDETSAVFPGRRGLSERCWFACRLTGPDGYSADLIYVTTTLTRSMPWRCRAYWTDNDDFPDQSTADQFFDPDQFEAYRQLGRQATAEALAGEFAEEPEQLTVGERLRSM